MYVQCLLWRSISNLIFGKVRENILIGQKRLEESHADKSSVMKLGLRLQHAVCDRPGNHGD